MLTGPADQTAAPDGDSHGRMRTSRADREQAIDALKVAYVQGRLTKDEFDERLGRALAPLTHAELPRSPVISRTNWPRPGGRAGPIRT